MNHITVKMIVEKCGINRNSFYYHYQDIPSLIEEITKENAERIISQYPTISSAETALNAAVDFVSENRRAILHIYHSANREIFERYLWQVCDYVVIAYGKTLTTGMQFPESDKRIIAHFYRCECFGIVISWLNRQMEPDLREEIPRLCELHHGMIEEMLHRSVEE